MLDQLIGHFRDEKTRNLALTVDRKSTRLNSSHLVISYAVFCLKKKKHTRRLAGHLRYNRRSSKRPRAPHAVAPHDRRKRTREDQLTVVAGACVYRCLRAVERS